MGGLDFLAERYGQGFETALIFRQTALGDEERYRRAGDRRAELIARLRDSGRSGGELQGCRTGDWLANTDDAIRSAERVLAVNELQTLRS